MRSLRAPIDLTLSDLQWPKSRSFRYRVTEEQYSVNIYFIVHVVAFDINLGATSCSLVAGGVFRCPSGLSCLALLGGVYCDAHVHLSVCLRVCVCPCLCLLTRYLTNYFTNQLHFLGEPCLWRRDEVVKLWEKSPRGKGGCGGSKFGPNNKR